MLGLMSLSHADELRNYEGRGPTSAEACSAAKEDAESFVRENPYWRIGSFGACDCSKKDVPEYMQHLLGKVLWFCSTAVRFIGRP